MRMVTMTKSTYLSLLMFSSSRSRHTMTTNMKVDSLLNMSLMSCRSPKMKDYRKLLPLNLQHVRKRETILIRPRLLYQGEMQKLKRNWWRVTPKLDG